MKNDRPLTTADLAARGRDAERIERQEADRTQPVGRPKRDETRNAAESRTAAAVAEADTHPFFPSEIGHRFRELWREIQVGFVDDPRGSVHKADALVAQVMQSLAEVFANERSGLEGQWSRGSNVSTEELRVALQRYRAFFDRLLSM